MTESKDQIFHLTETQQAHAASAMLFDRLLVCLGPKLPMADIQHVGATAIPGCLTKGDLDIVVRVPQRHFRFADEVLGTLFSQNTASARTETFSAFEDADRVPPLGIQLVVMNSDLDVFHHFRDALGHSPALLTAYNDLKRKCDGAPMQVYRAEKDAFIADVLTHHASSS